MIPSKGQPNLPRPGAGIPPKRMPGPGAGVRPGMPRPGFPMQTGPKPLTPTDIPETAHSLESPFSAEPKHEETHELASELTNPEENRPQSLVDTDEEPEIKAKKKHFEPKNFEERENTNEDEEPHTAENPNDNYVSLTESLKAMQSLRNNFVSFGEGFGTFGDDIGTPERTYKETDEEDYVKVESAEELPSKDLDDEHYDDEEGAHSPEEHHTIHGHRVIRENYIEEIHEEAHEESRREDDEEEEVHEKQESEQLLDHYNDDTHEEITPQNIPQDYQEENDKPEEPEGSEGPVTPTLGHQQEEIDPEGGSSAHKIKEITSGSSIKHKSHHHEFLEKSDPEDDSQEKVMFIPHSNSAQVIQAIPNRLADPELSELTASAKIREEKNKFLDDFEYGEEERAAVPITTHTHEEPTPTYEIKPEPELLAPPRQRTEEKVIEKHEEEEEITPPSPMFVQTTTKVQEEEEIIPPPTIATFTHETKVQEEEEILPPPKVLFIPQSAGSNKPKTVASSPFGITTTAKPESAKIKSPFTPSYKAPESATTRLENKIATPVRFEPEAHVEEGDIDIPEGPETSLIVRLKKAEIELRKERVKNERIQNEKDSLLHENQSLKSEAMEIRSKLQVLEKSRDAERLAQKEQETIEKLKAELKSTIEGSRLVNEHSNRIINESTKYKQDIEAFINSLEEEKKELQQTIIQLKTQIHQENLKNETLTQKIEFLEQKSQEYEASFDLIQRRTKDRSQAFEKLTSLSENAKSTLESLPKVEDLISKIQPIPSVPFTTNVQTSTSQLILPKDQGLQVAFEPKSSTTTEPLQKSGTIQTKPVNPFHVNKPTTPQKTVETHTTKIFDLPLQQKSSSKADKIVIENVKKSHDFDDDLNLLLENESPLVKVNPPQSSADKNKGSATKIGGRRIEGSPTAFDKKEEETEKDIERENEKEESLSTILHKKPEPVTFGTMKKSPSKKEPTVSFSQNIPSLSKQKDDLAMKKQSAGLKSTQWDLDESAASLKNSVQLSESDVKDKPEESAPPKFTTPQSKKPVIPNFANSKLSTEENKKKSGPLIIGKINNDQDKPSTTTAANKPKPVNFGNINLGKSGSRYTQPKKGLGGNIVTDEADSFFDDLGLTETPGKGGNNALRESVTSLRSSTSNMSRKIPPTNQFV